MEINNNKFEKNIFIKNNNKLLNINKKNISEPFRLLPVEDYNKKEMGIKCDSNIIMFEKKISNNKKRNNSINPKKRKEKTIKYNIFFNGKIDPDFPIFECSPNFSLSEVRQSFPEKYKKYIFLYDGYPIGSEKTTKVSEIANDNNNVYLKNGKFSFNNNTSKQIKADFQKLNKNSIYEYYLYPNSIFNEEEEKECISLLLLGETGAGKTTFLNSLINFVLKVNYSDNYRYLLVNEKESNNSLSQTKEVNIYYIKSHNSYPPLKIIDTPGFGDTSGHNFDKKIAKMIFEKFKEIKDLSAVGFICKYNEERFNFSQRYIFNCIINLFAKDMAENFMVLFSFCDIGEIVSKKCFEDKDSPFYKIMNRIKEPWYLKFNNSGFFAEKKNEIIEEFFKMGNESFVKLINKLKSLRKIKLELSSEVNIKREKLDNISLYIQKKLIDFANFKQLTSYTYSEEGLFTYYCCECKFFSDKNKCLICKKSLNIEYGNKYFNFSKYPGKLDSLFSKCSLEIYSNLFQLEYIMQEYNNITLKNSHETLKEFLSQIQNENQKISQNLNNISKKYIEYRTNFYNQANQQKEFALYLFNQLQK